MNDYVHTLVVFLLQDNPLVLFTKFLVKTVEEKNFTESVLDIEAFKKSFSSLDNYVIITNIFIVCGARGCVHVF